MKNFIKLILIVVFSVILFGCDNTTDTNNNNSNVENNKTDSAIQEKIDSLEKQIKDLTRNYNVMCKSHKAKYENNKLAIQKQMAQYQKIMFIGDLSNYQVELNRLNQEELETKRDYSKYSNYEYDARIKTIEAQRENLNKLYENRMEYEKLNNQITKLTDEYNALITKITTRYDKDLLALTEQLEELKK